jgi:signal transduction protein with GAF and PtsI domain
VDEPVRATEETSDIDLLHEIGSRMAAADPFHEVLQRVIEMVTAAVRCDSCFLYVLEKDKLVLRASKNPHEDVVDRMAIDVGQGVTGWVAEHRQTVEGLGRSAIRALSEPAGRSV